MNRRKLTQTYSEKDTERQSSSDCPIKIFQKNIVRVQIYFYTTLCNTTIIQGKLRKVQRDVCLYILKINFKRLSKSKGTFTKVVKYLFVVCVLNLCTNSEEMSKKTWESSLCCSLVATTTKNSSSSICFCIFS